jgi:hypothetical protein
MEVVMTGKITAAVVAAIVFVSAGVASAQTNGHSARISGQQAAQSDSYYNGAYWRGIENVAPHSSNNRYDPLRGTYWDGVAPY